MSIVLFDSGEKDTVIDFCFWPIQRLEALEVNSLNWTVNFNFFN